MDAEPLEAETRGLLLTHGVERLELEFRLGHVGPRGFRAGVTEAAWQKIWKALEARFGPPESKPETREELDENTGARYDPVADTAVFKRALHRHDFPSARTWAVRGSLSLECPSTGPGRPPGVYAFWRHKRRDSWTHECWRFDLTRVRSNLPGMQDDDTFEVEVELAEKDVLFGRPLRNVLQWGRGLLESLLD